MPATIKKISTVVALFVVLSTVGCNSSSSGQNNSGQTVTNFSVAGSIQKGPYLNGSSVAIYELDKNLNPTGKVFNTQTNSVGAFQLPKLELASNYAELKADGYYFNEVTGDNSVSSITLYALVDLTDSSTVNINLLTHLERGRIKTLMANGTSFADAKKQAHKEVLALFNVSKDTVAASETLDMSKDGEDNSILLAISAILQGYRTDAELSELLANLSDDLNVHGALSGPGNGSALINSAVIIDPIEVKTNLEARYSSLGVAATVPDTTSVVNNFVANTTYERTEFITYPPTGASGANVLDRNTIDFVFGGNYSMCAVLPRGYTLKVRVFANNPQYGDWAFAASPTNDWLFTNLDNATYSRIFTANNTGTIDLRMIFMQLPCMASACVGQDSPTTFEVYENGSATPTWTRTVTPHP